MSTGSMEKKMKKGGEVEGGRKERVGKQAGDLTYGTLPTVPTLPTLLPGTVK